MQLIAQVRISLIVDNNFQKRHQSWRIEEMRDGKAACKTAFHISNQIMTRDG